jgi:peptidylprolyl isomerase
VLRPGTGTQKPGEHDTVRVRITSYGGEDEEEEHEEPRKQNEAKTLTLSGVIPGFRQALLLMTTGERRRVWIPDELGYKGRPGGEHEPSVFDIELVDIVRSVQFLPAPKDVHEPPPGAERSKSGLAYLYLEHGQGEEKPQPWDRVTLDYDGWTADGKPFESSRTLDHAATFDLGSVIRGWAEVLPKLVVGDRVRLWVPRELGYDGRHGRPQGAVVFDLTLRSIERRPEPPRPPALEAPAGATKTSSGLAYQVLEKGAGQRHPSADSRVKVQYSGWTADGELFDSTVVRGHAATVRLDRMMPGWVEGLQKMTEGEHALFWIPEKLAYGGKPVGKPGRLIYEIELLQILP